MEASAVAISTTPGGAATATPGSDPDLDDSPAPASADGEGYRIFPAPRHSGWKPERPTGLLHAFGVQPKSRMSTVAAQKRRTHFTIMNYVAIPFADGREGGVKAEMNFLRSHHHNVVRQLRL